MPNIEEILGFACDFYRAPLRYNADLQKAKLGDAVFKDLLEMIRAREKNTRFREYAEKIGVSPDDLHGACIFLIKRLLFKETNNHYQVLGLTHNATAEGIRRHYRLLITLFHPDRVKIDEAWIRIYVTRLNEAYSTLKNPGKRDLYDRGIANAKDKPVAMDGVPGQRKGKWVQKGLDPSVLGSGSLLDRLYRFNLWQQHPKWVVTSVLTAILAVVLIGLWPESKVDQFRRNESAQYASSPDIDSQDSKENGRMKSESAKPDFHLYRPYSSILSPAIDIANPENGKGESASPLMMDDINLSQFDLTNIAMSGTGGTQVVFPSLPGLPAPASRIQMPVVADLSGLPKNGSTRDDKPENKDKLSFQSMANDHGTSRATPEDEMSPRPRSYPHPNPLPVGEGAVVLRDFHGKVAVAAPQDRAMKGVPAHERVLARFILAYEEGDMDHLLSLFAADVVTNEGIGIDWVKREYGLQFEETKRRTMRISNVKLLSSADVWIDMKMRFEIDRWNRDDESLEHVAGEAIMSLHKSGNRYLIKEHKRYVEKP